MHAPDFSIVIPSFNQARYLERTLHSLFSQEGVTVQILVQDGGSTDGTVAILEGCADRIEWVSAPDGGQAEAINRGLEKSQGRWLGYLNSDDILLPGALQRVKSEFLANPEASFIYGQARRIDENDFPLNDYPVRAWDADLLKDTCFISQPACFWRREVGQILGGFNEDLRFSMDYDFWLRGNAAGLIFHYLPLPLAAARIHGDAKTMHQRACSFEESFATMRRHCPGHISKRWVLALAQVRAENNLAGSLNRPMAWLRFLRDYRREAALLAKEHGYPDPLPLISSLLPKCINSWRRLQAR